jgi:pyridinium-3,5-biscarboxylic acid mononucleotide sulfurtransferase
VRDHDDLARVEVAADRLGDVVALAAELDAALRALGWRHVTIDVGGFRSGSMNAGLPTA